jgi:hypothetical protein
MKSHAYGKGLNRELKFKGIEIKFVKEDCWIGVYWKRKFEETWHRQGIDSPVFPAIQETFTIYICIIPTLPIIFSWSNR